MSSSTSAPIRIFKKIKRRSSAIFGSDHPSLPLPNNTDAQVDDDSYILPCSMGYLTLEMIEEARLKLNETDDARQNGLKEIRQLIANEKNLECRSDEIFLLQFLRARKFNVKNAFKLLQNYYQFRKEYSDIYDHINVELVKQVILNNFLGFLTKRDRNGSIVFLFIISQWNPDIDAFDEVVRTISAVLVSAVEDPAVQVTGFRIILDCRGMSWKHLRYCTPQNIHMIIRSTQFCFPARYRAIHMFSENRLFNLAWAIVHPCLTNKLKKRIIHHGKDVSALQDYIHPSVLPLEFGGTAGPFDNLIWTDRINNEEAAMLEMLKYGYK